MKYTQFPCNDARWTRECQCNSCGGVVKVKRSDLFTFVDFKSGKTKPEVNARCVCGYMIKIDETTNKWNNLPNHITWSVENQITATAFESGERSPL